MQKIISGLLIISLFLSFACATIHSSVIKDKDSPTKPYAKVLVIFVAHDYQSSHDLEGALIDKLQSKSRTEFIQSTLFFPPTRKFSSSEKQEILKEQKIDAELIVYLVKDYSYDKISTVPQTSTTYGHVGDQTVRLNTTQWVNQTSHVWDWAYELHLFDLNKQHDTWFAAYEVAAYNRGVAKKKLFSKIAEELAGSALIQ